MLLWGLNTKAYAVFSKDLVHSKHSMGVALIINGNNGGKKSYQIMENINGWYTSSISKLIAHVRLHKWQSSFYWDEKAQSKINIQCFGTENC